jgi:hypothetical protein
VEYAEKIAKHAPKLLEHMKSQLEKKSKWFKCPSLLRRISQYPQIF